MNKRPLIVPLEYINERELSNCGNKIKCLFDLYKTGFSIPKSWVVFNTYILEILQDISSECGIPLSKFEEARKIISEIKYTNQSILKKELEDIIINKRRYVIRSSNHLEDQKKYSFAGIFISYINESYMYNIFEAIKTLLVEGFSVRVSEYCKSNGITHLNPCTVLLQELINTEVGGVYFDDGRLNYLNSNYGLVKSIVEGMIEPDQWIIKDNIIKESKISDKNKALLPILTRSLALFGDEINISHYSENFKATNRSKKSFDGTVLLNLPGELSRRASLREEDVIKINKLIQKAKNKLNFKTCDVEWAIDKNGEFYFLQIREVSKRIKYFRLSEINQVIPLVSGRATGVVKPIISEKDAMNFKKGEIILAKTINGAVIRAMTKASAAIIISNSTLSHSSIIAREWGIPCVSISNELKIEVGSLYRVDGAKGFIEKLNDESEKDLVNFKQEYDESVPSKESQYASEKFLKDLLVTQLVNREIRSENM